MSSSTYNHNPPQVPTSSPQNLPAPNEPSSNTDRPEVPAEGHSAEKLYQEFKQDCKAKLNQDSPPVFPFQNDNEHWARSFKLAKQHDTDMCKRLSDDIDTLLVFIGLFAAVVTAFTIESYQWLEPESEDLVVQILLQVSAQLADSTAPVASVPDNFSSSFSSKSINILWFLSLSTALLTALLAILCQQWLREYAKDMTSLPYKAGIALRQIRLEAFHFWKVEGIVSLLPILLQLSLLLFFAGLLDLLWTRDRTVALIISCVVGIGFAFVIATTFFPVIVAGVNELVNYREASTEPDKQQSFSPIPLCAYKSPQSWIWLKAFFFIMRRTGRLRSTELSWMNLEARWLNTQEKHDQTPSKFWQYRHAVSRALCWLDEHCGPSQEVVVDIFHCLCDMNGRDGRQSVSQVFEKLDPFTKSKSMDLLQYLRLLLHIVSLKKVQIYHRRVATRLVSRRQI